VVELALEKRHPWLTGELLFWLWRAGERVEAPGWIAAPFRLQIEGRWAEAAEEWQRRGCVYEVAQALAETGETEALQTALAEFDRLGAQPAAQRVRRWLRERGGVRVRRGPRTATRQNPLGLTRRQLEVLHLLCDGLQNQEIAERLYLSSKTVDHHVSAVLAKLGVHTRGEAAREAIRLGIARDEQPETLV